MVELIGASNGGSLGVDRSVNVIVPDNDNPYGTVYFEQTVYRFQEPLQGVYRANITVHRRYFNIIVFLVIMGLFKVVLCTLMYSPLPVCCLSSIIPIVFILEADTLVAWRSCTAPQRWTLLAWLKLTARIY